MVFSNVIAQNPNIGKAQSKTKATKVSAKPSLSVKKSVYSPENLDLQYPNSTIQPTALSQSKEYSQYGAFVNPFVGTGGHGHTFPGAAWPFGMVQLSPDTRIDASWDGCGGYHYSDSFIFGFSHTHLSGTGVSDYGDILVMPLSANGLPSFNPYAYRSEFSHTTEKAEAGYYSVYLEKPKVKAELTVSPRMGIHRYSFYPDPLPGASKTERFTARLLLDLIHRDPLVSFKLEQIDNRRIGGWRQSKAWADNQWVYFAIEFSQDIDRVISSPDGKQAIYEFDFDESGGISSNPKVLELRVGISFASEKGALLNLVQEQFVPHPDLQDSLSVIQSAFAHLQTGSKAKFEDFRRQNQMAWNAELGKIEVHSEKEAMVFMTPEQAIKEDTDKRKFYTALYHCMIHPSLASDYDGVYRGRDQKLHRAFHKVYTVFSLWDTYRALHPLLSIIDEPRTIDFIRTILLQYQQGKKLPVWELGSCETECMIGYHSVSVIADIIAKGIGNNEKSPAFDQNLALEAMVHSSHLKDSSFLSAKGYKLGYMGIENSAESVSKLLEYSYDDWCIGRVAYLMKHDDLAKEFFEKSERWRNVFDTKTGFMRPRENGGWLSPFDPKEVNNHYTEANAWQYSMYVPHDIQKMMAAMGGVKATETHLDSLFGTSSITRGRAQSDISGLIGQYAHGNEPSHHMAYLYNYCSKPEKGQKIIDRICTEFYLDTPDGLIGNEDCGQMSAWYVMSAMGFYPVCPGSNLYQVGSPQLFEISLHRSGNNTPLRITKGATEYDLSQSDWPWAAHRVLSPSASQIPSQTAPMAKSSKSENGMVYPEGINLLMRVPALTISHEELRSDFGIVFSKVRPEERSLMVLRSAKQSMASDFLAAPVIEGVRTFLDSAFIRIYLPKGSNGKLELHTYSNGSKASSKSTIPDKKIITLGDDNVYYATIKNNTVFEARIVGEEILGALKNEGLGNRQSTSDWTHAEFSKRENDYGIELNSQFHVQYSAGGKAALTDGIRGNKEWRSGYWQGYYDQDFEALVDMGSVKPLKEVAVGFLQDCRAWIFMPRKMEVWRSVDGKIYLPMGEIENTVPDDDLTTRLQELRVYSKDKKGKNRPIKARYIKIKATNYGNLPVWHQGYPSGGKSYIFLDEIMLR